MVVKVAKSGDVIVDGRQLSVDELDAALAKARESGGAVTYYRESPRSEPTEAANEVFRRVMDARVTIQLGHQAPSEWGELDWVEVERAPHQSRFFMAKGQPFLMAYSEGGPEPVTYVGGPLSAETEARWLEQVDLLVRSDRVMETPPHEPNLAFSTEAMHTPSLHLRLAYGDRRWASRYRLDDAPSHIRTFEQDLSRVGHHLVASSDKGDWQELTAEEAGQVF
ncbi:MAG TPA: hypothetical protein VG329_03830 [Candidatus Dormibacteraeota bacterium]|nr:hypothetical protein [Candidatus Dormibacteraeota bacterium]